MFKKTVENSVYFLVKRPNVAFYDKNGKILHLEAIQPNEKEISNLDENNRFYQMLDDSEINKMRPKLLIINNHTVKGRCLFVYDQNNQLVYNQAYVGPVELKSLALYQKINPFSLPLDYDWIMNNPSKCQIKVLYKPQKKGCIIS